MHADPGAITHSKSAPTMATPSKYRRRNHAAVSRRVHIPANGTVTFLSKTEYYCIVMQSEVSQKNKYQILMWNLENKADEPYMQNRNRDTDVENKCMTTKWKREGWDELGDWD